MTTMDPEFLSLLEEVEGKDAAETAKAWAESRTIPETAPQAPMGFQGLPGDAPPIVDMPPKDIPTPYLSQTEAEASRGKAYTNAVTLLSRVMPEGAAKRGARQMTQSPLQFGQTMEGSGVSPHLVARGDIRTMGPLDAMIEAQKRQVIISGEDRRKQQAERERVHASVREGMLEEAATRVEESQAVGPGHPSWIRPSDKEATQEAKVRAQFEGLVRQRRQAYLKIAADKFEDYMGRPPEDEDEVEDLGLGLYVNFLWGVSPVMAREVNSEWTMRNVGREVSQALGMKYLPETGDVVESEGMRAMRTTLGAVWTPVAEGMFQGLTWETDENGVPLDEEDLTYRMSRYMSEDWLEAPRIVIPTGAGAMVVPVPFGATTRTAAEKPSEDIKDWLWNPAIESGSYWRDVAWSTANMRWGGNDMMAITSYQKMWGDAGFPNAPAAVALGASLWAPFTPLGPAAKIAQGAGDVTADAAKALGMNRVGQAVRDLSHPVGWADRVRAIDAAGRAVQSVEGISGVTTKGGKHNVLSVTAGKMADEVALPYHLLDSLESSARPVDEALLSKYMRSDLIRQIVYEIKAAHPKGIVRSDELSRRLWAWRKGQEAMRRAGKMSDEHAEAWDIVSHRVAVIRGGFVSGPADPISVRLSKHARALRAAIPDMPNHELRAFAYRAVAKDAVAARLLGRVPEDMQFLTPFHVISARAMAEIEDELEVALAPIMSGQGGVVKGDSVYVFKNPEDVKQALFDAVGPLKISSSPFFRTVVKQLDDGGTVSEESVRWISAEIKGDQAKKLILEHGLKYTDLLDPDLTSGLTRRARVPVERRIGITETGAKFADLAAIVATRVAPDFSDKVAKRMPAVMREVVRDYLPSIFRVDVGRTPTRTMAWIDEADGLLQTNIEGFKREYYDILKANNGNGPLALQKMVDRTLKDMGMKDFKGGSKEKTFLAWRSILNKFFGGSHSIEDASLKRFLGGDEFTGAVDDIIDLSADNLKMVIEAIRESDLSYQLYGHGLRTRTGHDHIAAAMFAWMVEERAAKIIDRSLSKYLGRNPEYALRIKSLLLDKPAVTKGALQDAMRSRGVPEVVVDDTVDVINNLMRNIAGRMSDEDRFNLLRMMMSYKIATGNVFAELDNLRAMPRAVGQLMNKRFLMEELANLGVADDALSLSADSIISVASHMILSEAEAGVRGLLVRQGMTPIANANTRAHIVNRAINLETKVGRGQLATVFGKDTLEVLEALTRAAKSGSLDSSLKQLREADEVAGVAGRLGGGEAASQWGMNGIAALYMTGRRATISGELGGFLWPNVRFHGLNTITAPLIVSTTLGAVHGFKSIGLGKHNTLVNWAAIRFGRGDKVLGVVDGVPYTRKMMNDALKRNNVRYGMISFEFDDVIIRDLMRQWRVDPGLNRVGVAKTAARYLDPTQKNIWNRWAEMTDNYFRQNVFASAVLAGRPEAEAARLSQKAMLDYGAIPATERMIATKVMFYYAFMRQMAVETAKMVIRDPNMARRQYLAQRAQHMNAGSWAYEGDSEKQRLWVKMGPVWDQHYTTGLYGPHNPALMAFDDMLTVLGFLFNETITFSRDTPANVTRGIVTVLEERAHNPYIETAMAMTGASEKGTEGRLFPDHLLLPLTQMGALENVISMFNLVPAKVKEKRPGKGELPGGVQYRFHTKQDEDNFIMFMSTLNNIGLRRAIDDLGKVLVAAGHYPEGSRPKARGDGSWVMVLGNIETPLIVPDNYATQMRAHRRAKTELENLARQ